jgi:hypothetical protein
MHILTLSLHALFRALFTCKFAVGHGIKIFFYHHYCGESLDDSKPYRFRWAQNSSAAQARMHTHSAKVSPCMCIFWGAPGLGVHDKTRQGLENAMI